MKKVRYYFLRLSFGLITALLFIESCKKEGQIVNGDRKFPATPVVSTEDIRDITPRSAMISGNVLNEGASAILDVGVCWDTLSGAVYTGNHYSRGPNIGYGSTITGLKSATKYYIRGYARNSNGVGYGQELQFVTLPADNREKLSNKKFAMTAMVVSPPYKGTTDLFATNMPCETDDIYYFFENGLLSKRAVTKCNFTDVDSLRGTWSLEQTQTVLHLSLYDGRNSTLTYTILQNDEVNMKLLSTPFPLELEYMVTTTFIKK